MRSVTRIVLLEWVETLLYVAAGVLVSALFILEATR